MYWWSFLSSLLQVLTVLIVTYIQDYPTYFFVVYFCISHFTSHFLFSFFGFPLLFLVLLFDHHDSPVSPNQPTNQPTFPPGARPCLFTAAAAPTLNFSPSSGCHLRTPCGSLPLPSLDPNCRAQHPLPATLRHNTHKELQMLSCESERTIVVPFENQELICSQF